VSSKKSSSRLSALILSLALLLISNVGCSKLTGRQEASAEAKGAVVRRSVEYVSQILNGKEDQLNAMIFWSDYLESKQESLNKEGYFAELKLLREKLKESGERNPLLGLDLEDLDIRGNRALITLGKVGHAESPKIKIRMEWVEFGWLITGDSVFGRGGLRASGYL